MNNITKVVIKWGFKVPDRMLKNDWKYKEEAGRRLWYEIQGDVCVVYLMYSSDDSGAYKWACNTLETKGILQSGAEIKLIEHRRGPNPRASDWTAHAYKNVVKTSDSWSQESIQDEKEWEMLYNEFINNGYKR
jgi:hypothetical protein